MDKLLEVVQAWLQNPEHKPTNLKGWNEQQFLWFACQFFLGLKGGTYHRGKGGKYQLVVEKKRRMYMLQAAYDALGHHGMYATKEMIKE